MPIYEFVCNSCAWKFDYLVRGSHDEIVCPKCKRKNLKRLVSSFSFASKDGQGHTTASSSGCSGCTSRDCSGCSG